MIITQYCRQEQRTHINLYMRYISYIISLVYAAVVLLSTSVNRHVILLEGFAHN